MLAVDWLGCLLSAGVLALLLRGPRRPLRAGAALLFGEAGRVITVLLVGGDLLSITVGGAFTRLSVAGTGQLVAQAGGLLAGAVLALLLGRRMAGDTLLYALLAGGLTLVLIH